MPHPSSRQALPGLISGILLEGIKSDRKTLKAMVGSVTLSRKNSGYYSTRQAVLAINRFGLWGNH
jgi:hypothetical protein